MRDEKIFGKTLKKQAAQDNTLTDFQLLLAKWEKLSANMTKKPLGVPIILPDIFLVSSSGSEKTHFLDNLTAYLTEKPSLMNFSGDVKSFSFLLNYCEPCEDFSEIRRFMAEIDNAAGFRRNYRGIVLIDVDEWLGHFEEKHFICFMEYLSDHREDWLIVLSVSDGESDRIQSMEAFVSSFIRIERLTIARPTVADLLKYAKDFLQEYDLALSADAERLLSESIEELSENKYFDGYRSIKMLCEDIAYFLYTRELRKSNNITAEDLLGFERGGEYTRGRIFKISQTRRIGFY